jgi:hypothetical protein
MLASRDENILVKIHFLILYFDDNDEDDNDVGKEGRLAAINCQNMLLIYTHADGVVNFLEEPV